MAAENSGADEYQEAAGMEVMAAENTAADASQEAPGADREAAGDSRRGVPLCHPPSYGKEIVGMALGSSIAGPRGDAEVTATASRLSYVSTGEVSVGEEPGAYGCKNGSKPGGEGAGAWVSDIGPA